MTKAVKISITIEIEKGQKKKAEFVIQSDHFGQRIMEIQKQVGEMTCEAVLARYDDQIRQEEAKGLKVLGREKRLVTMECGEVEIKRRVYQQKDGKRWKPLDKLFGLEKYQRRDEQMMERNCVIAAQSTYRRSAEINSYLNEKAISASTIGRDVKRVGGKTKPTGRKKGCIMNRMGYGYPYRKRKRIKQKSGWRSSAPASNGSRGTAIGC